MHLHFIAIATHTFLFIVFSIRKQYAFTSKVWIQFTDDSYVPGVFCCGGACEEVSDIIMLCKALCSSYSWIRGSHMELNVQKLNVMWLNVNSFKSFKVSPILLNACGVLASLLLPGSYSYKNFKLNINK